MYNSRLSSTHLLLKEALQGAWKMTRCNLGREYVGNTSTTALSIRVQPFLFKVPTIRKINFSNLSWIRWIVTFVNHWVVVESSEIWVHQDSQTISQCVKAGRTCYCYATPADRYALISQWWFNKSMSTCEQQNYKCLLNPSCKTKD